MLDLKAIVEEQLILSKSKEAKLSLQLILRYINDYLENEQLEFEIMLNEIPLDIGKRPAPTGLIQKLIN